MSNQSVLPEADVGLEDFERFAGKSVSVICKVVGFSEVMQGNYYHKLKVWKVSGVHGDVSVSEWWPMPAAGTGNKVV